MGKSGRDRFACGGSPGHSLEKTAPLHPSMEVLVHILRGTSKQFDSECVSGHFIPRVSKKCMCF